jgi:starch phosphorylase
MVSNPTPADLRALALDLTWTLDERISRAFQVLSPEHWENSGHNPALLLARLGPEGIDRALERDEVRQAVEAALAAQREHQQHQSTLPSTGVPLNVAYFSMEFGLTEALPIYAGGLGILAGDHLKAASDLGISLTGVGLLYRKGYGRQRIDEKDEQTDVFPEVDFTTLPLRRAKDASGQSIEVQCPLGTHLLQLAVWQAQVGCVSLVLLDSDIESNPPELRDITDQLYAPEPKRRLPQEIVLGIGGMRALDALGIKPNVLHMNEGHGFLVAVERILALREQLGVTWEEAGRIARASLVFTTHTPVAAGSDYFAPALVNDLLGPYLTQAGVSVERFLDLGRRSPGNRQEHLCTTYANLRTAGRSVGVSQLHGAVSRQLWKDAWPNRLASQVPIGAVTNGVHLPTWLAPEIGELLQRYVDPQWWDLDSEDRRWERVDQIPDEELWQRHRQLRQRLLAFARQRADNNGLDPEALIIGFSRRFAPYKRANLVLSDPERLGRLLGNPDRPVQMMFAGKAHPADLEGKRIVHEIVAATRREHHIVFLPDYDIEVARPLVQGSDLWLNNPRRFLEASGTSGMKAAANGVLNLSVLDGWWDEGYRPEIGWAIPSQATIDVPQTDDILEAEALYRLLEEEVVPLFFERDEHGLPRRWLAMMRASIREVSANFSARRMLVEYFRDYYVPAAQDSDHVTTASPA